MLESIIVLGIIAVLAAVRLASSLQNVVWFQWGMVLIVAGLLLGVPTGFYYHLLLWRILSVRMLMPRYWWLSPQKLHTFLKPEEYTRLKKWFTTGGVGFFITLAGCVAAMAGLFWS